MRDVAFYFDFISPYVWLALGEVETFAERHGVRFDPRPVVYGKLLDTTQLVGPGEVEVKRRYTWLDVSRLARRQGRVPKGPPAHPFRSLEALRTAVLFRGEPNALGLIRGISDACWLDGRDITDVGVLADVVDAAGLDATDLGERIADASVKDALRGLTEDALQAGVFGVPSFVLDGEIFWGHDRLPLLAERVAGAPGVAADFVDKMNDVPRAARRAGAPQEG